MSNHHDSFLDTLPNGWAFDRLKDVVSLRNEKSDEASTDEDYIELEDLESGTGKILNRRNTLAVESAVTLFKKGDVLFGKLRPYLEKYYEAEFDGKCTGEILAFKPERMASRFLFYCVASRWFVERCKALAYGAKMPRVSWEKQLSQFYIPLPHCRNNSASQHIWMRVVRRLTWRWPPNALRSIRWMVCERRSSRKPLHAASKSTPH
jgi:type I restriction enzyme S subunit